MSETAQGGTLAGEAVGGDAAGGETALQKLADALRDEDASLTRSERTVAAYFKDNISHLPFETGAAIAQKTGVSEMTVIRFVRRLGYASLRDFKEALRASAPSGENVLDDALERFRLRGGGVGDLDESLELELRAVVEAYELTRLDRWRQAVDLIGASPRLFVTGFQGSKGLALDFATRLKYAREGVRFAEGASGVYSEVLESPPDETCLVLIDTAAYARRGVLLARKARELKLPLVVVTDRYSNWAYEFTDLVLQGSTAVRTFWDSSASLSVILNLLINAVANARGDAAAKRFETMRELGRHFREFEQMGR